jgi:hypothetical protein
MIGLLVGVSVLGSLGGGAWLAWTSDIIPPDVRGTFFARRLTAVSVAGLATNLVAGKFLAWWEGHHGEGDPTGFVILFAAGLLAGIVSTWVLARIPAS